MIRKQSVHLGPNFRPQMNTPFLAQHRLTMAENSPSMDPTWPSRAQHGPHINPVWPNVGPHVAFEMAGH